jgi:hypothetical protein
VVLRGDEDDIMTFDDIDYVNFTIYTKQNCFHLVQRHEMST